MAKRVRGSRSGHRPGGMGPSRSKKPTDATSADALVPSGGVDIDRAIEDVALESEELLMVEASVAAPEARKPRRGTRIRTDSLEARMAAENIYVADDLRRIGLITLGLVAALFVFWVLLVPLDLGGLY